MLFLEAINKIAYKLFIHQYNLTSWMIRDSPIRIAANNGLARENPPRMNDIIPKIIINTEAIFDMFWPEETCNT